MTREEAINFWKLRYEDAKDFSDPHWDAQERREHREYVEALRMAIEALSADCISRQAVLSILNGFDVMDGYTDQQRAIHMVELLPSTEPKTGHWRAITAEEDEEMAFLGLVECTNCGLKGAFNCNYCPNCGAYMKGEQEEDCDKRRGVENSQIRNANAHRKRGRIAYCDGDGD